MKKKKKKKAGLRNKKEKRNHPQIIQKTPRHHAGKA